MDTFTAVDLIFVGVVCLIIGGAFGMVLQKIFG